MSESREEQAMERVEFDREAIKRAAIRATRQSAALERRTVPSSFIRSEKADRFIAKLKQSTTTTITDANNQT